MTFKTFKTLGFSAIVVSSLACVQARAEGNDAGASIGVVGAFTIQNPSVKDNGSSSDVSGKKNFGGGVQGELVLAPGFGLEVDALYLNHKFSRKSGNIFGSDVSSTFTSGYLEVPVLVRYRPIPFVNVGLGGYYSRVVTAWKVSAEGLGSKTYNDSGKNDFGVVGALGTMIPVSDKLSIVADLRYTRSLTDSARQSNDALKFADVQIMAGIRFGMR